MCRPQTKKKRRSIDFTTLNGATTPAPDAKRIGRSEMLRSPVGTGQVKEEWMTTPPADEVGTKLLFENERVRVWDLALAPGESLAKHVHRTDYFFIVESGGLVR